MLSDERLTMSDLIKEQAESERDLAFFQKRSEKLEAELLTLRAEVERLRGAEKELLELAKDFDGLSNLEMPDPKKPTPIYVSRMHFDVWAERIRDAFALTPPTKE